MQTTTTIHPDALELAALLERDWPAHREAARRSFGGLLLEGEGDGDGDGDGDGNGDGDGDGNGDGDGDGDGDGEGEGDWKPPSRAEWDNTQRQRREAAEKADRLEKEKKEREDKEAEDRGEFKEIAEREKKRADEAEAEKVRLQQERRVEKIAGRLNFRDPQDVMHRLSDEDLGDDRKVEKALKNLAKSKPYLTEDGEKPRQRDLGSGDGEGDGDAGAQVSGPGRLARAYADKS